MQINADNNTNSSIKFIPAKCPSCGGELRVPDDRETVKCMYCGSDVIIHDTSKVIIETRIDINKTLNLAKEAERGKNFQEAYRYYTMIVEQDPDIPEAWMGKGFSAGMLSTPYHLRIEEATHCIIKGLYHKKSKVKSELAEMPGSEITQVINYSNINPNLRKVASKYYCDIASHLTNLLPFDSPDIEKQEKLTIKSLFLYKDAYALSQDDRPGGRESLRNIIVRGIDLFFTIRKCNYALDIKFDSKTAVKLREYDVERIKITFEDSELKNDPEIISICDDFIAEARKKDKCYIATATLGNYDHSSVITLRRFRDLFLLNSTLGRKLVEIYYIYSPSIAQGISQHKFLRGLSLFLIIRPFVFIARLSMRRNSQNK